MLIVARSWSDGVRDAPMRRSIWGFRKSPPTSTVGTPTSASANAASAAVVDLPSAGDAEVTRNTAGGVPYTSDGAPGYGVQALPGVNALTCTNWMADRSRRYGSAQIPASATPWPPATA